MTTAFCKQTHTLINNDNINCNYYLFIYYVILYYNVEINQNNYFRVDRIFYLIIIILIIIY